ncbi:MAG TPA: HEAT repeat domain-containing protein [Bryobacteraceae bacterium]|nr:HEAT repeat domain-containing protein [Bryobacteraceae bacterium]
MRSAWLLLVCTALFAGEERLSRLLDSKLTATQRNDACVALRGDRSPEVLAAMRRMLSDEVVRACAARNLREAGAAEELKEALQSQDAEVRAVAARELGALARPEYLPLLAEAALDPNALVATNAVRGLTLYQDRAVVPYLLAVARKGGMAGLAALERAAEFHDARALATARELLDGTDVASKVVAMQVIGDLGDASDVPRLRAIAAKHEKLSTRGRGFGLLPTVDLGRAAENAIAEIQKRASASPTTAPPRPNAL